MEHPDRLVIEYAASIDALGWLAGVLEVDAS